MLCQNLITVAHRLASGAVARTLSRAVHSHIPYPGFVTRARARQLTKPDDTLFYFVRYAAISE